MKKYFVTGSSGFIGTNLLEKLLANGDCVLGYDILPVQLDGVSEFTVQGSLLDEQLLRTTMQNFKPTHVIHLAARTDLDGGSIADYPENIAGVENIIKCCDEIDSVERVIFASSRLVCEIGYNPSGYDDYRPTTAYGESKVAGERIVKSLKPRKWVWSIVRPTSIWGPWFGVPYRNFFDLIRVGRYFHPKNIRVFKSFGYVGNVVHQIISVADAPVLSVDRKCFYVGDYDQIEVLDFANKISNEFKVNPPSQVPVFVLKSAAVVGDILAHIGIKFPLTSFRLKNLLTPMPHDFSDLRQVVGDLPFSQEEGIRHTVSWMKEE